MRIRKIIFVVLMAVVTSICTSCTLMEIFIIASNSTGNVVKGNMFYGPADKSSSSAFQEDTVTTCPVVTTTETQTTTVFETTIATKTTEENTVSVLTTTSYTTDSTETTVMVNTAAEVLNEIRAENENQMNVEANDVTTEIATTEPVEEPKEEVDPVSQIVTETPPIVDIEEITESTLKDALVINGEVMDIFYGPANQKNVDEHDVVQDTELFSNSRSTFFFGHNYGSFWQLKHVKVGDTISVFNDGIEKKYVVTRSEKGELTENGMDIKIASDGEMFVNNDFGYTDIRLSTCYASFSTKSRWIVVAQLIS